jgi:hypothetical protein
MPSWFPFLRLEAELAITFINAARLHSNPANSARSLGNARVALAEIHRGLMNARSRGLTDDDIVFLEERCTVIELAIQGFGSAPM